MKLSIKKAHETTSSYEAFISALWERPFDRVLAVLGDSVLAPLKRTWVKLEAEKSLVLLNDYVYCAKSSERIAVGFVNEALSAIYGEPVTLNADNLETYKELIISFGYEPTTQEEAIIKSGGEVLARKYRGDLVHILYKNKFGALFLATGGLGCVKGSFLTMSFTDAAERDEEQRRYFLSK